MKQRSNVISYVTVNDSPDSDSSLSSPYAPDPLSSLRSTGGALELPSRAAADSSSSRTIIVPPLKMQLNDCIVATQASGGYLRVLCQGSGALLSLSHIHPHSSGLSTNCCSESFNLFS